MSLINHSLIIKFAMTNKVNVTFSGSETLRISIVSAIGSLNVFVQMICAISVLIQKNNQGLHDIFSQSVIVYCKLRQQTSLDIDHLTNFQTTLLKPQPVRQYVIDFID